MQFSAGADDVGIVDRGRDGDTAGGSSVDMTKGEGKGLKAIGGKFVFVVKNRVMGRARGAKESTVAREDQVST